MATCNYIQNEKQNASAMWGVIRYVSQEYKTVDEDGRQYLSGVNCNGSIAFKEFLATKNLYRQAKGRWFYQYVQSFAPGEITDYDETHRIGLALAERFFPGCEVLVATHLDAKDESGARRVHNHFIVNSVKFETGRKVIFGPHSVEEMRKISDELCVAHNLSVLKPFVKDTGSKTIGTREYRATLKGDGWKFALINDIDAAMQAAATREEFLSLMQSVGYSALWSDTRKYITWTCPNGMKVRDNKLHEQKYLKENIENEFRIRKQLFGTAPGWDECTGTECLGQTQSRVEDGGTDGTGDALPADRVRDPEGRLGGVPEIFQRNGDLSADAFREDRAVGNEGGTERGLGRTLAVSDRLGGGNGGIVSEIGAGDRSEGAESAKREPRSDLTGWEDAREIFIRSRSEGANAARRIHGGSQSDEGVYDQSSDRNHSVLGAVQLGDLSFDEIKLIFQDARGDYYRDLPDEDAPDADGIGELRRQAKLGNVYAKYRLSRLYLDEDSRYYSPRLGEEYLYDAAEAEYPYAEYRLGRMYFFGIYFDEDAGESEYWLNRAAEHGNRYAEVMLGKAYLDGEMFAPDRARGFELLYKAEREGSGFAAYTLGSFYMKTKNLPRAIEQLELAAGMGNAYADYKLAEIFLFEADYFDYKRAVECLDRSERMGNVYAYRALCRMAENTRLAIVTNVTDVVAGLTSLFEDRPDEREDCTGTAEFDEDRERRAKRKHEHELSM